MVFKSVYAKRRLYATGAIHDLSERYFIQTGEFFYAKMGYQLLCFGRIGQHDVEHQRFVYHIRPYQCIVSRSVRHAACIKRYENHPVPHHADPIMFLR